MMAKVYLDPGHGGSDSGAVGHGLQEKDVVLSIAKHTRNYLQNNYKNVSVRMSRTGDTYPSLTDRTNDANSWGADAFVSIHINAGGGVGYEDYIFNGSVSDKTHQLQNAIHNEVSKLFDTNRGKKRANFAVLRQSAMSGILTENGFIDNKSDADYLSKDSNLKKLGEAHAKGIAVFLGLAKGSSKTTSTSTSKKKSTKNKSTSKSKPNLKVDGYWGKATTRALQKFLGTVADGEIWYQYNTATTRQITSGMVYGPPYNGSPVIKELQKKVGGKRDGLLGPDTVKRSQKHLKTPVDGEIWKPSTAVKELQRRLNAGTF